MDLHALGYDERWEATAAPLLQPGQSPARVMAVDRDSFQIRDTHGDVSAELAGRFRFTAQSADELPVVGDWVCVQRAATEGPALIQAVLPRRTFLGRKRAGRTAGIQMIAANLDTAFLMQGCLEDFNVPRLERYLVMVHEGGIEPVIVLSKTDLIAPDLLERRIEEIRGAGIPARILPLSNATGEGLEALRESLVPGRTTCLLGSSGVGKTTLLNRLVGREAFMTRAVSGTGEGVHTTSRRQLLVLGSGALLIDTPGMREFGLLGADEGLEAAFEDIEAFAGRCRFPDCTHVCEPGCAVLQAVAAGELEAARHQRYLKLRKEAAFHGLSHAEKRRKDKAFGKMVKNVLKRRKG